MHQIIRFEELAPLQQRLNTHPVYAAVAEIPDLRVFMSHHIYSVWDFMSLIKFLQGEVAPVKVPWTPSANPSLRYFINQLVLEEESDEAPAGPDGEPRHMSHFELYCDAMREVGADPQPMLDFLKQVRQQGVNAALAAPTVPAPAREFTSTTFGIIDSGKAHCVAAALAVGREHVIPDMFRAFLANIGLRDSDAPAFHYYLNRHIHLDEDFHAPLSLRLVDALCENDDRRIEEARATARQAIEARLRFWDGVLEAIQRG